MFKKVGLLALTVLGVGLFIQPTKASADERFRYGYQPGYYAGYDDGRYYRDNDRDEWRRHERREREEWRERDRREDWREHERWERYRDRYYEQPSFYFRYRY